MKKKLFMTLGTLCLLSVVAIAQSTFEPATNNTRAMYKAQNPATDMIEMFDVTGTTGATFTTSNISDGTSNSYKHSLRITLPLQTKTKDNKTGTVNLVFYTEGEQMPYAAANANGALNVYYPRSMYESIKEKLDQYLLAKKKIQLKVTQKADGYREGSLTF